MVSVPGTAIFTFFTSDLREGTTGDNHRAVAFADAAARRQQSVVVLNVGERVKRDCGQVVNTFHCFAIQRLDVAEGVCEAQARYADFVGRQPVEHEGIVGVGAVGDGDLARFFALRMRLL